MGHDNISFSRHDSCQGINAFVPSVEVGCLEIEADLFSELFIGTNNDVVQFVRQLNIWALQARKSDADVVIMISLLLDGPTLDWYVRLVPIEVKNDWARLQQALLTQFQKTETPEAIWKDIRRVRQGYEEDIRDFIRRFEDLYRRLERLGNNQVPPDFMKRDQFIVALHEDIKEKVDDKEPESFERAKEMEISKWRKRMRKLGRDMREDDEAIEGVTPYAHKIHEKSPEYVFTARVFYKWGHGSCTTSGKDG